MSATKEQISKMQDARRQLAWLLRNGKTKGMAATKAILAEMRREK